MAATKKSVKKVVEVVEAKPLTSAEKLKAAYTKLDEMNVAVQTAMQEAYRFARDNQLMYSPPSVVRDDGDEDRDNGWDSSYC